MAITNAQQYQQLVNKPANGKRPGYRGDAAYRSDSEQSTSIGQGNVGSTASFGGGQASDGSEGAGAINTSQYTTDTQDKNNAAAIAKGKAEKAAADKKAAEAKAKEEKKQEKKEAKAKAKKDKKTKRMQKAAFDRFQRLEKYVDPFGDETTFAGMSGEEAAKLAGYKGNLKSGFEYDKDFFRDPKTGKIKDELTEMVNINLEKRINPKTGRLETVPTKDIFGRDKKPKFVEQFRSDINVGDPKNYRAAIPGYDFSPSKTVSAVRNNFDGGLGTLTSTGGVRPNDYPIQPKTGTSLDMLSNFVRPEDGLQAFNTLEEARNVQDFAGRFQGGDESAYEEFEDYITRNKVPTTGGGGGNQQQTDPCKGPNPPAYCNVGNDDDDDTTTPDRNLGGLAPRFAGSIFDFTGLADGGRAGFKDGEGIMQMASAPDPMDERNSMMETIAMEEFGKPLSDLNEDEIIQIELFMEEMSKRKNEPRVMAQQGGRMMNDDDPTGGIMDLESGRQMYFLGKLVKKATRAVKKVVKSPIGKAALMYFGGNALMGAGGGGGLSSFFKSGKGLGFKDFLTKSFLGPELSGRGNRSGGILGFMKNNPYLSILGGSSILAGLSGKGEDEGEIDYGPGIDINKYRYGNYLAPNFTGYGKADGGRIGYAEGSEEPVAKETMPLIDMDGKEMDLREDGGFVPLGRMERADDVPARLSKNEFVFTADAVRNAGEGDIDKGAEVMYNMMKNLESGGDVSEESQGLDGAREMFQTSQRLEEVL